MERKDARSYPFLGRRRRRRLRLIAAVTPAFLPGFMNFTSTRWPISNGAPSALTTTSTTRSSAALGWDRPTASLRAPNTAARRSTLPT